MGRQAWPPPYPLRPGSAKSSKSSSDKIESKGNAKNNSSARSFVSKFKSARTSQIGMSEETRSAVLSLIALTALMGVSKSVRALAEKKDRQNEAQWLEEANKNKSIKSFDEVPKLRKKMSAKDSMKVTNPSYPSPGTTMNCTFCTTAMALREKGYDVKAAKRERGTYTDALFQKAFNSPERDMSRQTADSMLKELGQNGEGSYGNLTVHWKLGGGHSIFWKVENGNTKIYDGQNGREYTNSDNDYKQFFNAIDAKNIQYSRLDNHEPTEYALALVEKNR